MMSATFIFALLQKIRSDWCSQRWWNEILTWVTGSCSVTLEFLPENLGA